MGHFDVYAATGADVLMTMSPTYNGNNVTRDQDAVAQLLAATRPGQAAVGIATSTATHNYNWTQPKLHAFMDWAVQRGVTEFDVWRGDIDHYGAIDAMYFQELAAFLHPGRA